ncbi:MAG: bifunctional oligoribonuclease/PAP phosphatase NrnA [Candidatus Gracilibacteria bacterium]|nr:bifunctional oligoribonuclease/PAP phosphatase NrnA [bacterium]MDZ4216801.1 bifunctional oligoribonuclease/PAP phosphatase NrnA [Candidatus Gracilibacteria bacterium]
MIQLDQALVDQIRQKIIAARKILLISHKNPDGDTLGAALGMYWYLDGLGKDVVVGCFNAAAESLSFLPGADRMIHDIDDRQYDLVMSFDTADPKLSGFLTDKPEIYSRRDRHINIDHHASNQMYGGINLVVTNSASTTQVLYYLFTEFGAIFTREIATCLLTGLYTDTGSFMHQNTNAETLRVGGALLRYGADLASISKQFFNTKPVNQLRLWGRVLNRAQRTSDEVIISAITYEDMVELGADKDYLSGAIEFLKYVPGIRYAKILSEEEGGKVKGSLRTIRDDVNVSEIASEFGGGGHVKAAGFTIPGKLEREVQWKVVE